MKEKIRRIYVYSTNLRRGLGAVNSRYHYVFEERLWGKNNGARFSMKDCVRRIRYRLGA